MTAPKAVAAELALRLVELGVTLADVKHVGVQHLEVCPFPQTKRRCICGHWIVRLDTQLPRRGT